MDNQFTEQKIKEKLSSILQNPIIKLFTIKLSNSEQMLTYIPEFLMIIYSNERGKQLLIETGIYKYITED